MRRHTVDDLKTYLHQALSEAVMSRIVVTDEDVSAFQRVHSIVSKLPVEEVELTDSDWKRIGAHMTELKEEK